jgi:hypothetical protein
MFKNVQADLFWTGEMTHVSQRMSARRPETLMPQKTAPSIGDDSSWISYHPVQPHEYRARILDCSVEGKAGERIEYGAGQWEVGSHCQQSRQGSPARGLEERDAVENEAVYCIAYNTVYIKFRSIAQTSIIRAGDQASARTFPSVGICSTMAPLAVDTCTRSDESYGQCAGVRKYAYDLDTLIVPCYCHVFAVPACFGEPDLLAVAQFASVFAGRRNNESALTYRKKRYD